MSLFCPGVSWGKRRRAVTRGASYRRRRVASRGISTENLSTSEAPPGVEEAPKDAIPGDGCRCGSRRKRRAEGTPPEEDGYGGVFMGPDKDWEPKTVAAMDSIVYFDDSHHSLGQSYLPTSESEDNSRSGTPYELTPQPTRRSDASPPDLPPKSLPSNVPTSETGTSRQETSNTTLKPPWARQRRYLPTADDVDFDKIDEISLDGSVFATPAHLKALVNSPQFQMSPVYQNLVDQNLSDVYLQAQKKALVYSSTPAPVNLMNVAQPPVMRATSKAVTGEIQGKQVKPDLQTKSTSLMKRSPFKQLSLNTPSIFTRSKRSTRHGNKLSPKKKTINLLQKNGRTSKPMGSSLYNNQHIYDAKENDPSRSIALQKHCVSGAPRRSVDLRKTALTRNMLYGPTQKCNVSTGNVLAQSYDSPVQPGRREPLNESVEQNPLSFVNAMKQFEELIVSSQPSCERSSSTSSSSSDNEIFTTSDLLATPIAMAGRGRVVCEPKFADNSGRKARIVSISPSSVDYTSSESSRTSSPPAASPKDSKLGTSRSASSIYPRHEAHHYARPQRDKQLATPYRQLRSETNIRNAEAVLSRPPQRKVRCFNDERPRQVEQAPEHASLQYVPPISGLSPIEEIPSPPNRKVPVSREPCGQGLVLFNYSHLSEGDIAVKRGERVTILNCDDKDWLYVKADGEAEDEGFVPRSYVFITTSLDMLDGGPPSPQQGNITAPHVTHRPYVMKDCNISPQDEPRRQQAKQTNTLPRANHRPRMDKQRRKGPSDRYLTLVETYVVVQDHIAGQIDECNVKVGDIVFVNSKQQRAEQIDWMWVMVVGDGKTGYIPAFSACPANFQASNV